MHETVVDCCGILRKFAERIKHIYDVSASLRPERDRSRDRFYTGENQGDKRDHKYHCKYSENVPFSMQIGHRGAYKRNAHNKFTECVNLDFLYENVKKRVNRSCQILVKVAFSDGKVAD